ncbi:MAG TPA: glycosyltransferase family 4 protein [Gemmatimonadaceae bacterium]
MTATPSGDVFNTIEYAQPSASSDHPPRLLLIGNFLGASPGRRAVGEDLAEHLRNEGWSVLLTSRKQSRYLRVLDRLVTAWRERHRYDVAEVDVYSGSAFRWAELMCRVLRAAGKPYVLTLHGGNLPALAKRSPTRVKRLLAGAAVVTAPSRYVLDAVQDARPDLRLIHNPIEPEAYTFRVRRRPAPRMIWVRAFHEIYNPGMAPRVLARLTDEFPASTLTMLGPDKDGSLERTRERAASECVLDRLTIVGGVPRSEVPTHLDVADIFLNTTNIDNSPVSVLEAMASGLCVVSTNVGGMPYLIEHERDGLLVPADDADAMAAAVRRILTEPGLAARLSRNARAKAERFTWDVILPQWKAVLHEVARRHAVTANA